jgi:hypothetical protein
MKVASYSSADMHKMLPANILNLQGHRLHNLDSGLMQRLLEKVSMSLDECRELRNLAEDA